MEDILFSLGHMGASSQSTLPREPFSFSFLTVQLRADSVRKEDERHQFIIQVWEIQNYFQKVRDYVTLLIFEDMETAQRGDGLDEDAVIGWTRRVLDSVCSLITRFVSFIISQASHPSQSERK